MRFVYNWGLAIKNQEYTQTKTSSNYYELNKKLQELKKDKKTLWLNEVYSQTLQSALRNLDNAFTKFFKKKGMYPRFKSKNKNDFSFQIPQGTKIVNNRLYIPKVKDGIKIKLHRTFDGKIKTVSVSKNPCGQYFITLLVECEINLKELGAFSKDTTIGIDLGIKEFAVISNGTRIQNPKNLRKKLKKLKTIQRRHSRKQKGSVNRNKSRIRIARLHNVISNQRHDFLHKFTHTLTHNNQVRSICIEDLAVSNMIKNHKLAQAISDVSWGEFRRQLEYKCLWQGKNLIVINRFAPSSKLCSNCGQVNANLTLDQRTWTCSCEAVHDRDLLAANNIRNFGIEQYRRNYGNSNACGETAA